MRYRLVTRHYFVCTDCKGSGQVTNTDRWTGWQICERCKGSGEIKADRTMIAIKRYKQKNPGYTKN